MIPVTVIMTVKNEVVNLPHSLPLLVQSFSEVIVVDSNSDDQTAQIAKKIGAQVVEFTWNGQYPKKRQWVLDNVKTLNNWVLMIDADEIVTNDFIAELQSCDFIADGYFVSSKMVWKDKLLNFGQRNNKLCLFDKKKFNFPIVDDLDVNGMGEIEGHYQPVPIRNGVTISKITSPLIHYDRKGNWHNRHDGYINWEVEMTKRNVWPKDPVLWREFLKSKLRSSYIRPYIIFFYGYIFKLGFLDGVLGFDYAFNRARYTYHIVRGVRAN